MEFLSELPVWGQVLFWDYLGVVIFSLLLSLGVKVRLNVDQGWSLAFKVIGLSVFWPASWAFIFWDEVLCFNNWAYIGHLLGGAFGDEKSLGAL